MHIFNIQLTVPYIYAFTPRLLLFLSQTTRDCGKSQRLKLPHSLLSSKVGIIFLISQTTNGWYFTLPHAPSVSIPRVVIVGTHSIVTISISQTMPFEWHLWGKLQVDLVPWLFCVPPNHISNTTWQTTDTTLPKTYSQLTVRSVIISGNIMWYYVCYFFWWFHFSSQLT